jgi:hypothetical protein
MPLLTELGMFSVGGFSTKMPRLTVLEFGGGRPRRRYAETTRGRNPFRATIIDILTLFW